MSAWVWIVIFLSFILFILYAARHIISGFLGLYRIVPVNEAHIRILHNKKEIFSARSGKSAYWFIPFITKLHKLPLCNLPIPVNDIKLNDKNMAKFVCDIMCFVVIDNIDLAVERLTLTNTTHQFGFDFQRLIEDMRAVLESISRTTTTKQSILDIYMDRTSLDAAITKEVEAVFPKWGIKLVDLELKDIKDAAESTIIADIERKVAAEIHRDAEIRIANTTKESEMVKAATQEEYMKRQIERDQAVGIARQQAELSIAEKQREANMQTVEALRVTEVGRAEINKQRIEQDALAQGIKYAKEAEGESKKITSIGDAEAHVIKAKKVADAEGTEKLAEAMKKFDDQALSVKLIDVQRDVFLEKYRALSTAVSKANIKWILSGAEGQNFFGLNLNAEGGAQLEQFAKEAGISLDKVKELAAVIKKTK